MGTFAGGHVGAGGVWTPLQAESVLITDNESYAILESVEQVQELLTPYDLPAPTWITVHPKEGGRAIIQVSKIVGFVSQGDEAQAG